MAVQQRMVYLKDGDIEMWDRAMAIYNQLSDEPSMAGMVRRAVREFVESRTIRDVKTDPMSTATVNRFRQADIEVVHPDEECDE